MESRCSEAKDLVDKQQVVEETLGGRRKRWSNPLGMLKGFSAEGLRNILYSSK
jgi:hypothetical protein